MAEENYKGVVGVLFTSAARWYKNYPFRKKDNNRAYARFARIGKKKGLKVVFAYYKEYKRGGILRRAWEYDKGWKKVANQNVDLIYGRFNAAAFRKNQKVNDVEKLKFMMADDISVINHPELEEFCWDKRLIAEVFPEYCPGTHVVNTKAGLKTVLSGFHSDKIVLKPRFGTLGKSIKIIDNESIPKSVEKNTLVQEFIDTSKGIDGIVKGIHDLRLIIANGKIDHAHVRQPMKEGVFTANMSLGGTRQFVPVEKLPKSIAPIVRDVDKLLSNYYPRLYSIDLMFDENQRPYIVELNSSPVIKRYAYGKYKDPEFYDRMFDYMIQGIKVKVTRQY